MARASSNLLIDHPQPVAFDLMVEKCCSTSSHTSVFQTKRSRRKLHGRRAAEIKKAELFQEAIGHVHFYLTGQNHVMTVPPLLHGRMENAVVVVVVVFSCGLIVNQVSVNKDGIESGLGGQVAGQPNWPTAPACLASTLQDGTQTEVVVL